MERNLIECHVTSAPKKLLSIRFLSAKRFEAAEEYLENGDEPRRVFLSLLRNHGGPNE